MNYSASSQFPEMAALLRLDLSSFICRSFLELNPQTEYLHNWHIDLIASKLTQVEQGKITRLIINLPPRNLKSICASVAFPAWVLGHNPSRKLICASYASELAYKLAMDCRQVMLSPWYQAVFPQTRLSASRTAVHDFATTERGGRMAVSTGGGITGRGGDILIIDDPLKPDEALSEVTRKNVIEWFDGTAYTRLDSKRHGAIVIIMQRLHLEDLVGYVKDKGGWEVINLPAIAEKETEIEFDSIGGPRKIIRRVGTALHPERESLETLVMIKASMGDFRFSGQYQQSPVPIGGGIIKVDWIKTYEPAELPSSFEMVVQSWDTANKDHQFADFSVCVTLGLKNKMIYVLDVRRSRMDYPTLKRTALELARQYKPHAILVEDAASGVQLVQDMKEQRIYSVKPIKPQGDKQTRLFAQSGHFESGVVRIPQKAAWVKDFVHEITSFPFHKFDDQVDAVIQGLAYLRERLDEPGLITYYRQLYIEKHGHDVQIE